MVFFHGGSYAWGATSDPIYDGHNLVAEYDDIVLVSVEFRAGILGFIDFSCVEGGEDFKESGNLGLLDQKCALEWVQKNIVAFVGGIAGIIGQTQKEKANTIVPGVAIATALMLPLCTCGYAIAHLDYRMLTGALYNFIVNFYFIILGSFIVLSLFSISKVREMTREEKIRGRMIMILNMIIIIIPAILVSLYRLLH